MDPMGNAIGWMSSFRRHGHEVIDDDSELHENYFEGLSYHYLKEGTGISLKSMLGFLGISEILTQFPYNPAGFCNSHPCKCGRIGGFEWNPVINYNSYIYIYKYINI